MKKSISLTASSPMFNDYFYQKAFLASRKHMHTDVSCPRQKSAVCLSAIIADLNAKLAVCNLKVPVQE